MKIAIFLAKTGDIEISINLHILNASGCFNSIENIIRKSFHQSIETISKYIKFEDVDFIVQSSEYVVLETGMAGYSPSKDKVFISIDFENKNLRKNFDVEFLATLGHELHHCLRHATCGYGTTLDEALVSEGLACHFETELRNGAIPVYASSLKNDEWCQWLEKMRVEFSKENYNHAAWFFGSSEMNIPRFAGYTVGFRLVDDYVSLKKKPASKLYSISSRKILP